ncbi:hypothetical protein GCM10027595_23680 [Corynebacterium nasicanis]
MEFEEFARQFRQRTTQRMMEFEKALAEAQGRVEKSVRPPSPPAQRQTPPRPASARGRVQGLLRKE